MGKTHDQDPVARAHEKALRLLAVRNRTSRELERRLVAEGYTQEVTEAVLRRLGELGLVDDRRFAIDRARSMGKGKGWGPRKLRSDLVQRGVPEEMVAAAVAQAYGALSCDEVMRRLVRKRFGEKVLSPEADRKARNRAQRYLLGKGFDSDEVWAIFSQVE